MTEAVDAGHILRQQSFAVTADETALSLNAKCYEAGLASFQDLLRDLATGRAVLRPQDPQPTEPAGAFHPSWARPETLATLDFSRPAGDLAALVRALDFGPSAYVMRQDSRTRLVLTTQAQASALGLAARGRAGLHALPACGRQAGLAKPRHGPHRGGGNSRLARVDAD